MLVKLKGFKSLSELRLRIILGIMIFKGDYHFRRIVLIIKGENEYIPWELKTM